MQVGKERKSTSKVREATILVLLHESVRGNGGKAPRILSALDEKWSASLPDRFTASEPVKNKLSGIKIVRRYEKRCHLRMSLI
jgi:hypothetical protein